jgi:siderophore synthetase component
LALACARERWLPADTDGSSVRLSQGPQVPLRRRGAFGLHVPDGPASDDPRLGDPVALWNWVSARRRVDPNTATRIADELADAAFNLAVCRFTAWCKQLGEATRDTASSPDPRLHDPEHLVVEGHPWHPMSKMRKGLSISEHLRLGPELAAHGPLCAVDVRRDHVRSSADFEQRVATLVGRAEPGWMHVPVHAAQLRRLQRGLGSKWGTVVRPCPSIRTTGRALASLRTVAFDDVHLKLSLDVHTTSARRIVSPMSVFNGPRVSALLARIQARDCGMARSLRVIAEADAAGLEPERVGAVASHLGVIVRDAADFAPPSGGRTLVCAGLDAVRPADGSRVLDDLCTGYPGSAPERAAAMLHDYVRLLAQPCLRLCCAWGIALEPHLQNTLVLADAGRPVGFLVRDLGGIRIHRPRLRSSGEQVDLDPASFIETDELPALQSKLAHTLLHAHLGTLTGWLEDRAGLPPARAWQIVAEGVDACYRRWASEPALRVACAEDRTALFAPRVRAKALFRMRVEDRVSDYRWTEVDNPLAACTREHGAGAPGSDRQ